MFATRFAPSPTGYLHRGHAFSALTAHAAARNAGGRFVLRIEDIDATRCRPEFEAAIYEDIAWLGLDWETPVRRQSEHLDDYQAALSQLEADGLLAVCIQHEMDHLEGKLFVDYLSELKRTRIRKKLEKERRERVGGAPQRERPRVPVI